MTSSCTPILVGVASPVSEILLPSKMAKFPFQSMVIKKINQLISSGLRGRLREKDGERKRKEGR